MKNTMFSVGEIIFYMADNKPTSREVTAIAIIEGEVKIGYREYKTNPGEQKTIYLTGTFDYVDSENAYSTMQELKDSLFNS